jgi:hypothetical protein
MKKWWKSKTIIFNMVMAGLVTLEATMSQLSAFVPANWYAIISIILPVGNAMLRIITTTGIQK